MSGAKNQVTLTFAGDDDQLQRTFDRVGAGAKKMGDEVGQAGKGFDRAGEATDALEGKAQGFRSTLTGTQDSMLGFAAIAKGDMFGGLVLLGGGVADLAEGFTKTLIPMAKSVALFAAHKTAMVAHAVAAGAVKVATATWAAVQWVLNAALTANPIGLIVVGIAALIAVVVLIATKTTWFQTIWKHAWGGIKAAAVAVWNWLKDLPEKIGDTFKKIGGFISAPFRAAFNLVSSAWNNTVGKLRWTVPRWVPVIGGNTIGAPQLPRFHAGGTVPGAPGREVLAILQAGERVSPAGSSGTTTLVMPSGAGLDRMFLTWLQELLARNRLKLMPA